MPTVPPTAAAPTPGTSTAPAPTSSSATRTSAATAISPTISAPRRPIPTASTHMRRPVAVKVGLGIGLVRKIPATLNHQRAARLSRETLALGRRRKRSSRRSFPSAHLRALFFQNRFTRKPDAVAFHRQHLHQHLIAFLQLVAHIGNAMLRHFANVQQPIGSRNNLDERPEIRQPRDFSKVGFSHLGRS